MKLRYQVRVLLAGVSVLAAQGSAWAMMHHGHSANTPLQAATDGAESREHIQKLYAVINAIKDPTKPNRPRPGDAPYHPPSPEVIHTIVEQLTPDTLQALVERSHFLNKGDATAIDKFYTKILTVLADDFCIQTTRSRHEGNAVEEAYLNHLTEIHNYIRPLINKSSMLLNGAETLQELIQYVRIALSTKDSESLRKKISFNISHSNSLYGTTLAQYMGLKASAAGIIRPEERNLISAIRYTYFQNRNSYDFIATSIHRYYEDQEQAIWAEALNNVYITIPLRVWLLDQLENPERRAIFPRTQHLSNKIFETACDISNNFERNSGNTLRRFLALVQAGHVERPSEEAFIQEYRNAVAWPNLAALLAPYVPQAERVAAAPPRQRGALNPYAGQANDIHKYATQANTPAEDYIRSVIKEEQLQTVSVKEACTHLFNIVRNNFAGEPNALLSLENGLGITMVNGNILLESDADNLDMRNGRQTLAMVMTFLKRYKQDYQDKFDLWLRGFIQESITAYLNSRNKLSCVRGIRERIITGLRGVSPELDAIFSSPESQRLATLWLNQNGNLADSARVAQNLRTMGVIKADTSLAGAQKILGQFLEDGVRERLNLPSTAQLPNDLAAHISESVQALPDYYENIQAALRAHLPQQAALESKDSAGDDSTRTGMRSRAPSMSSEDDYYDTRSRAPSDAESDADNFNAQLMSNRTRTWRGYVQDLLNSGSNVTDEQRTDAYIDNTGNW